MQIVKHYKIRNADVTVIRPDITDEERHKILIGPLTEFYHACLDVGIDISCGTDEGDGDVT